MKKFIAFLLLLSAVQLRAQNIVTASVVITNGTTNGMNIVVDGNTRTWTNNVSNPAIQIATNSTVSGVQSNLYSAYVVTPETSPRIQFYEVSTNQVNFQSLPGNSFSLTVSAGWASVTFSTNTLTNLMAVRVPMGGAAITQIGATERTNAENGLVGYLNDNQGTNIITTNAPALVNYDSTNGVQSLYNKTFVGGTVTNSTITNAANISGTVAALTNGTWTNPVFTNGVNKGNAFSSPGTGLDTEQFGATAAASTAFATAVGNSAAASGNSSLALGYGSAATAQFSIAIGPGTDAGGVSSVAIGANNGVLALNGIGIGGGGSGTNSIVIGVGSGDNGHSNVIVIGSSISAVAANQVLIGGSGQTNIFAGPTSLPSGIVSNLTTSGSDYFNGPTNQFATPISILEGANSSLVNGGNNIAFTTNSYLTISGPTGAFTIYGISGGYDGAMLTLENDANQTMTLANNSGSALTAGNRIITGYSADQSYTNIPGIVTLRYNGTSNRWMVISHN